MRTFVGFAACMLVFGASLAGIAQTVDSVAPLGVVRGRTTEVLIRGEGLGGFTRATVAGSGLELGAFVAESDALVRFTVGVGDRAALQPVDVTLEGSGELVLDNAFSVVAGPIELLTMAPAGAARGETVAVEFTGRNLDTVTSMSLGAGITITGYVASSPVFATADVTVTADAFSGARPITLSRSGDVETVENAFSVAGGPLSIIDLDPEIGTRGQTVTVSLQGNNLDTLESVSFGPRIDVRGLEIVSPRIAEATIEIRDDAAIGPRLVEWTTAAGAGSISGKFAVRAGEMAVTRIRPTTGAQGGTTTLSIEGFNLDGIAEVDAGAGITIGAIDSRFAGVAGVELIIAPSAPVGYRDLEITGTNGTVVLDDAFYVTAYVPPPIDLVFDSPVVLGNAQVGSRTSGAFYIENAGLVDEIVEIGPATGDTGIIRMVDPESGNLIDSMTVELAVDATVYVDVVFQPTIRTTNGITVPLTVRDGTAAGEVVVRGTGVAREFLLDPSCPIDFGVIDAGSDVSLSRLDTALSSPTATGATIGGVVLESLSLNDVPLEAIDDYMSFELVRTIPGEGFEWGVTEITPKFTGAAGDYTGTFVIATDRVTAPELPCSFRLTVVGEVAEDTGSDDIGELDAGPDTGSDAGSDTGTDVAEDSSGDSANDVDAAAPDAEDDTALADVADSGDTTNPPGGGGCSAASAGSSRALNLIPALLGLLAIRRRRRA
jgi:hypothetical protein